MYSKQRQTNIELLRVISMLMILVLHTRYDGILSVYDGTINLNKICQFLFEAISIVGVNIFILISGYFGISLKRKSIYNLLFEIYFYGIIGLIGWMAVQQTIHVDTRYFVKALLPISQTVWFIPNYLMLLIFSPMLNAFCEKYNSKYILLFTLILYLVSYLWTSILQGTISGFGGYSWGWFIVLYLTGRLIRRYSDCSQYSKSYFLYGYIIATLVIVVFAVLQNYIPVGKSLLWNYDCPLIYISSICLFMYFIKLEIGYIKWINWLAASSFAVLLFHVAPFAGYNRINQYLFENYGGGMYYLIVFFIVIFYYLVATLVDQVRILIFRKIFK